MLCFTCMISLVAKSMILMGCRILVMSHNATKDCLLFDLGCINGQEESSLIMDRFDRVLHSVE